MLSERPRQAPPVLLGVRGPKSLAAAGAVADGVVLAEPATPAYIAHALGLVTSQRVDGAAPRIATYDLAAVAEDAGTAYDVVRPALSVLALPDWRPHLVGLPFADDLIALAGRNGDADEFARRLPPEWISGLALAGTAAEVRRRIADRHAAGATTVVLTPLGPDRMSALEQLAAVLP